MIDADVIERIARIAAADQGLRVVVQGAKVAAERGVLYVPAVDVVTDIASRAGVDTLTMLEGMIDHEAGHARWTDFEAHRAWREALPAWLREAAHSVWNVVEDGWIEERVAGLGPGYRSNLVAKNGGFWRMTLANPPTSTSDRFLLALSMFVRGPTLPEGVIEDVRRFVDEEDEEVTRLWDLFAVRAHDMARSVAAGAPAAAIFALAEEIARELVEEQEHEDGEDEDRDDEDEDRDDESDLLLLLPGGSNPEAQLIALLTSLPKHEGTKPYVPFSFDYDDVSCAFDTSETATSAPADASISADVAASFAAKLQEEVLARFVEAEHGALSIPSLIEASLTGDAGALFEDTTGGVIRFGGAVSVLVDCSGSMHGAKMQVARASAYALHVALRTVDVPHRITGFTTSPPSPALNRALAAARAAGDDVRRYAHAEGSERAHYIDVVPWSGIAPLAAWQALRATNNNRDGEAVRRAARDLLGRSERTKVLLVLSDGAPASTSRADDAAYLKKQIAKAEEQGVTVLGIGVLSHAVTEFYTHSRVIETLSDLPGTIFDLLDSVML